MNAAWLGLSPLFTPCTCPFLLMFMISYPCNVLYVVSNEKNPIPGLTNRLSEQMVLLDEIAPIFDLPQFDVVR